MLEASSQLTQRVPEFMFTCLGLEELATSAKVKTPYVKPNSCLVRTLMILA